MHQCLVGTPTGTAKTNTNDTIIVTAMATDADVNDTLTYTLWWGNSSGNLSKTNVTATGRSGQSVTLEKSGLSNDTRYWFKVVVNDSIDEATSGEANEKTYCKGDYCEGGSLTYPDCTLCSWTGKVRCGSCQRTRINRFDSHYLLKLYGHRSRGVQPVALGNMLAQSEDMGRGNAHCVVKIT